MAHGICDTRTMVFDESWRQDNGEYHLVATDGFTILVPYHPGQVTATHLEIGSQQVKSTGQAPTRPSN